MPLQVIVSSTEGGPPRTVNLPDATAVIGRDKTCALMLEDDQKRVSRSHAAIDWRDGAYFLTVTSKINHIQVNERMFQPGQVTQLQHGDTIQIEPFSLRVEFIAATKRDAKVPPGPEGFGRTMAILPTWFGGGGAKRGGGQPDSLGLEDLITRPMPIVEASGPDLFKVDAAPKTGGLLEGLGGHSVSTDDILKSLSTAGPDPISLLSGDSSSGGGAFPDAMAVGSVNAIDALLGSTSSQARGGAQPLVDFGGHERVGSSRNDHVNDINLPMSSSFGLSNPGPSIAPPLVAPAPPVTAPPDQFAGLDNLDGLSGLDKFGNLSDLNSPAPPVSRRIPPAPDIDLSDFDPVPALAARPPAPAEPEAIAQRFIDMLPGTPASSLLGLDNLGSMEAPPLAVMPPNAVRHASPSNSPTSASTGGDADMGLAIAAFLRGLGMPHLQLAPERRSEFLESAGRIARTSIEGVMALLLARSELKKELKADDRTMIAARENNPLKIMSDATEAMGFLFDPAQQGGAYLPPSQAVEDACDDIRAHELALVAGVRAAVTGSIKRFAPANFEKMLDKKAGKSVLSNINRSGKLWDVFLEDYAKLDRDLADNLDRIFERDFLSAYISQVRILRGAQNRPKD